MQARANCKGGAGGSCHAYGSVLINKYNFSASAGRTHTSKTRQQTKQQQQQQYSEQNNVCKWENYIPSFVCTAHSYRLTLSHRHTLTHAHTRLHQLACSHCWYFYCCFRSAARLPGGISCGGNLISVRLTYASLPSSASSNAKTKSQQLSLYLSHSLTLFPFRSASFFLALSFILSLSFCLCLPPSYTLSHSFSAYLTLTAYRMSVYVCVNGVLPYCLSGDVVAVSQLLAALSDLNFIIRRCIWY